MDQIAGERRISRRYNLHFPLHYRVSEKGAMVRFGTGITSDLSASGLSFRCRKTLPVGAHVEILVDWPAKYGDGYPVGLQITGFVMRSDGTRTAVRLTSRKFRVETAVAQPLRASA
ncbi:MAG: PilZ domain-containing protein [Acidobacteriia bacterium]|nr:PilZ domain-containing protein [Terriglobia bacterium]